jgi:Protein of unknown function (DUF2958)
MELLPQSILNQLDANGRVNQARISAGEDTIDYPPVVKLFTPDAGATWLLSETDPDEPDIAFGLCDLGFGYPELGSVSVTELRAVRGKLGLPVERDLHFKPEGSLSDYADRARAVGGIVA